MDRPKPGRWPLRSVSPELERQWREAGYWDDLTIGAHLDRGLADHPDQVIRFHSAVHPWEGSFAEVRRRALGLAESLQQRGVGPGDPVAFQLPNWVEAAVTFYATAFLGAVVVPIVHFYGPNEVAYILRRTGVETFITASSFGQTDYLARLEPIRQSIGHLRTIAVVGAADRSLADGLIRFEELEQEPGRLDGPVDVDPSTPAIVAYTSGTTADPKGVIHSHRTIGSEVRQLGAMDSGQGRPNLVGAPVGHAMGMLGGLLIPVLKGEPVNLIDVWDPARILRIMSEFQLSCGSGATYFLTSLLDHPDRTPEHLTLMAYVGLGGSAIPTAIAERATAQGISIVRMYGSTEHPSITGCAPRRAGGVPTGHRRSCTPRCGDQDRRRRRSARGARPTRGDLVAGPGLLRGLHRPGADRHPLRQRRLVPDRRHRGPERPGLPVDHRSEEGRHHPGRRERERGSRRGGAADHRRRRRDSGGGRPRRAAGRAGLRLPSNATAPCRSRPHRRAGRDEAGRTGPPEVA